MPANVAVYEVDGGGTYLGEVTKVSSLSQITPNPALTVLGSRHWVLNTSFDSWGSYGSTTHHVRADNGSGFAQGAYHAPLDPPYSTLVGSGNVAGDLLLTRIGFGMGSSITRLDSTGATVFTKDLPESPGLDGAGISNDGSSYLKGQIKGAIDVGCGPITGSGNYLAKLDPSGQCVWSKGLGAAGSGWPDTPGAFLQGTTSGALDLGCGPMTGSGYVARLDPLGGCVWSKSFAATTVRAMSLQGGALVQGTFTGSTDLGCGPLVSVAGTSTYVARLDAGGACVWSRSFAAATVDATAHQSGSTLVQGTFTGSIDLGCGPLVSASGTSNVIARLDAGAACVWSRAFPASAYAVGFVGSDILLRASISAPVDFGGGPVQAGGLQDLAIARLSFTSGAHVWSKAFGAPGSTLTPGSSTVASDGSLLLQGAVAGSVDFGGGPITGGGAPQACTQDYDCHGGYCQVSTCAGTTATQFAVRLDANGDHRWQRTWGNVLLDGCGAAIVATTCTTCAPGSQHGVTVERIAP